jgi:ABC-type sugar transport system ATPase subunit
VVVEPRLSVRSLSVRFGTHLALDRLDLDVPAGKIIALLGANGSGKSTTVKALTGINPVSSGCRVSVGGVVLTADALDPITSRQHGIRVVHQEAPLIADLTVAEAIAVNLGFPTFGGFIRWSELSQTTLRRLGEFGVDIDPSRLCRSLNPSERALVSLAIALGDIEVDSAVLILDEATASLSTADATRFLDHVRDIADRGLAVLMVTHRLLEVRQYCDEMVVLRDGVTVARFNRESFDERGVVHAMVGEAPQSRSDEHDVSPSRNAQARGLDVHELSGEVLRDVTLSVQPGEIVGIAGRSGGGAAELLRALAGLEPTARGRVTLGKVDLDLRSPRGPLGQGVCFISADRLNEGGIAEMTVAENLTLPKTERYGLGRTRAKRDADRMIAQLDIRPPAREAPFGKLSGGNQQKVILGRWLLLDPDVLLLDDPTVGVDPYTREVIFATITSLAQLGAIILIRSSEPEQLARHCTRVIVLRDGRVTREFVGADLNTEKISLATFA